jgi:hypothetical protein
LSDSLSGDAEFLTDYFESFRVAAVQSESLEDNLPLAVVQHLQKLTDLVAQVLISEQLEGRLGVFVTDDLPKFGRIIIADRLDDAARIHKNHNSDAALAYLAKEDKNRPSVEFPAPFFQG